MPASVSLLDTTGKIAESDCKSLSDVKAALGKQGRSLATARKALMGGKYVNCPAQRFALR